jgi:hypothetical protein
MIGMQMFNITNQPSINFISSLSSTSAVASLVNFIYVGFSYWNFKWRTCNGNYTFFILATQLCYDICPDYYYPDLSNNLCQPCYYTCLTCSTSSLCTSCDPLTNRHLNTNACLPDQGYFDNGTINSVPCSLAISDCLVCNSALVCTQCNVSYHIDNLNQCTMCSTSIPHCVNC